MPTLATLQEIETAIDQLTPQEYEELLRWMDNRLQPIDLQIKASLEAGRMDERIRRAKAHYESERTTPLRANKQFELIAN